MSSLSDLEPSAIPLSLVAIVAGVLVCFFGHRLLKVVLGLVGFAAGAVAAGGLSMLIAPENSTALIVAAAIGGAAGAAVLVWAFYVGVFLLGAAGGLVAGGVAAHWLDGAAEVAAYAGLALVGGALALKAQRVMLGVSTALLGAAAIAAGGLVALIGAEETFDLATRVAEGGAPGHAGWIAGGCWVLLSAAGIAVQLGTKGGKGKKKKKKDD
jgi:hypothetical protein